jgi:hypothetical protein
MTKLVQLLRCFLLILIREFLQGFKERGFKKLRLNLAKFYVLSVQEARRLVLGLIGILVCLAALVAGCVLLPVGIAVVVYNHNNNLMLSGVIFCTAGAVFVLIPSVFLLVLTSERFWMRLFRVRKVVEFASTLEERKRTP